MLNMYISNSEIVLGLWDEALAPYIKIAVLR